MSNGMHLDGALIQVLMDMRTLVGFAFSLSEKPGVRKTIASK